MNAPEWKFIAIGCLGAIVAGGSHTVFAILLAEIMAVCVVLYSSLYVSGTHSRTHISVHYFTDLFLIF